MKTTDNQLIPEITNNPPFHVKMSNREILDKISSKIQNCGIKKIEYAYNSLTVSQKALASKKEVKEPYFMMIHIDDDHVIRLWIDPRYDTKTEKMTSIGFSTNLPDSKYHGAFFYNINEDKIVNDLVKDIKQRCKQVQDMKNSRSINEEIANKAIQAIKSAMPDAQVFHQDIVSREKPITKERIINISVNGHTYRFKPRASKICNSLNHKYFDVEQDLTYEQTNAVELDTSKSFCECTTIGNEDKFVKKIVAAIQTKENIEKLSAQLDEITNIQSSYDTKDMQEIVKEYQKKQQDLLSLEQSYKINDDKEKQILKYIRENARQRQTEKEKQRQTLYNNIQIHNIQRASDNRQQPLNLSTSSSSSDISFWKNSF